MGANDAKKMIVTAGMLAALYCDDNRAACTLDIGIIA
jgi:hypothetical protein